MVCDFCGTFSSGHHWGPSQNVMFIYKSRDHLNIRFAWVIIHTLEYNQPNLIPDNEDQGDGPQALKTTSVKRK